MTSKQVMLTACGLALALLAGCQDGEPVTLESPYEGRQVWAVVPLRNESGTRQADGMKLADKLVQRLETVEGLEVLPVSRVLAAMERLELGAIESRDEAMELRQTLTADGLVLGTITAYDPYAPPRLGLAIELYLDPVRGPGPPMDVRELSQKPTAPTSEPTEAMVSQPVSAVSALYDANMAETRQRLADFAATRGRGGDEGGDPVRLHRISIDLYSEFVAYAIADRLLEAERQRLAHEEPESD